MRVVFVKQTLNDWGKVPLIRKGDILTIKSTCEWCGLLYYEFTEIPGCIYHSEGFRPVDDTFGPAVCERIEEQIEYEKAIEV